MRSSELGCFDGGCDDPHRTSGIQAGGGCHSTTTTTTAAANNPTTHRTMTTSSSSSSTSKFPHDDMEHDLENPPMIISSNQPRSQPRTCQCACSPRTKPPPSSRARPTPSLNEKNPLDPTVPIHTLYSTTFTPSPSTAKQTRRRNQKNRKRRQRYSVPFVWGVEGSRAGLEMLVQAIHYLLM